MEGKSLPEQGNTERNKGTCPQKQHWGPWARRQKSRGKKLSVNYRGWFSPRFWGVCISVSNWEPSRFSIRGIKKDKDDSTDDGKDKFTGGWARWKGYWLLQYRKGWVRLKAMATDIGEDTHGKTCSSSFTTDQWKDEKGLSLSLG